MRTGNLIFSILEELQRWAWPMNSRNRVASCKRGDWRLLDKDFRSKQGGKIPNRQFQVIQTNEILEMAQQFITAPILSNPYIIHTLNNMNLVKIINNKKKD